MLPSNSYKKLQQKLQDLIAEKYASRELTQIKGQLEKEFMTAWNLAPDRLRLGSRLNSAIRLFRTRSGANVRGFDHCSYYTGLRDQRVVVTQPYDGTPAQIVEDLTLDNATFPEVIDATEWAFYYPGRAGLFVVKFPFDFQKQMEKTKRRWEAEEKEQFRAGMAQ